MPITGQIPLPESGFDSFLDAMKQTQENKLRSAQAQREQARANLPFGGEIPPGPAGQTVGLEMVKMLYGQDSPQYQQAKRMYDLNQQSTEARVNYQNILSGTAPKRFSTNLGKTAQEFEDIKSGFLPGTRTPLNEEQKEYYGGKYGSSLLKSTSDTDTRKKNLYAHNMDITLSKINPEALTQYSGLEGATRLLKDRANSQSGKANTQYKEYEKSLTAAKTLAKQVRQFYGDSITSGVQEGLKQLTNPSSWMKSPEIALSNYNAFVDLLRSEAKTYQQATESPNIYGGKNENNENVAASQNREPGTSTIEKTANIDGVEYAYFNGAWHKRRS